MNINDLVSMCGLDAYVTEKNVGSVIIEQNNNHVIFSKVSKKNDFVTVGIYGIGTKVLFFHISDDTTVLEFQKMRNEIYKILKL